MAINGCLYMNSKKRKASIDGRIHLVNLARNWLHQAITYMDRGELVFRLLIELIEIAVVIVILMLLIQPEEMYSRALMISVSVIIVHTFNWVTNANFHALLLFAFPSCKNMGEAETTRYLNQMARRLGRYYSITGLAVYGSVARGAWHERSDVDIRILRRKGLIYLAFAVLLTMRERWLALIARQPVDLFLADDVSFLKRMRPDERPIFLIKNDARLDTEYPGNRPQKVIRLSG